MSSGPKGSSGGGAKETVLLRKAVPKYGFAGRKLPKESVDPSSESRPPAPTLDRSRPRLSTGNGLASGPGTQQKPVAVVGASFHSHSSSVADFRSKGESRGLDSELRAAPFLSSPSSTPNLVERDATQAERDCQNSQLPQPTQQNVPSLSQPHWDVQDQNAPTGVSTSAGEQPEDVIPLRASGSGGEQLQAVREERDKLRAELNAQLQVNAELKRLLVASVGDDLYERVENLCRDRAQLELDIGGFSKKMSEDYENLDKVSIQADMWRSKYLASRVMTEELSQARAYYSLQCHDAHTALQQLLNERQELRTNLVESYKVLQQVKNAFDPLNTHRSSSLRSTSVLDLCVACQQLVEAVRFRLLPPGVAINVSADVSPEAWQDSVTRGEQFAHEVLSRSMESTSSANTQDPNCSQGGQTSLHTRYHPATRYENLTMACCTRCRGEILVV